MIFMRMRIYNNLEFEFNKEVNIYYELQLINVKIEE
jgi:hypothetical protein